MSDIKLLDAFSEAQSQKQDEPRKFAGITGNASHRVKVAGHTNLIYVTVGNKTIRVYNNRVAARPGIKVWVGNDPLQPNLLQVLGEISKAPAYTERNTYATHVKEHNDSHTFPGDDTVWIQTQQFMPLRPSAVGGMKIDIYPHIVEIGGVRVSVPATTVDLSSYRIFDDYATKAKYVLLEVTSSGTINVKDGTEVAFADLSLTDIPATTNGRVEIAAVRIWSGMLAIVETRAQNDIVDLRFSGIWGSGDGCGIECKQRSWFL